MKLQSYTYAAFVHALALDWIEQCFMSPPTQYRLYGRQFLQAKDPTNSIKVLKEQIVHREINIQ